jgi:hypothetical protein
MKFPKILFLLFVLSGVNVFGQAQPVSFIPFEALRTTLKHLVTAGTADNPSEIRDALRTNVQDFALYALGKSVYSPLIEENRLDKQIGTSPASAGSTSLVSKGSVPSLIGLAVESGALYQSVTGTIVTFRLNPSGVVRALAKNSYFAAGPSLNTAALERGINRLSASASFDFQQGASPGTFTAERSQLREATVRFDIWNNRDPRDPVHAAAIAELNGDMGLFVKSIENYYAELTTKPKFQEWLDTAAKKLAGFQKLDDAALNSAILAVADAFAARFADDPELHRLGGSIVDNIKSYRNIRDKVSQDIAKSSVFTFEYTFNKLTVSDAILAALPTGTNLPDLSTGRLIFSSPVGSVGEATLNGSVTFFNSTLPMMRGSLRDVQVAGSLDFRLPELQGIGKPVLTFAGLGAFLHQQPFGVKVKVGDVETADGAIGVFQIKLSLPAGQSGVRIPLSFTVANRTEFNTEKTEVRGAIGVTFDLDKLFVR